MKERVLNQGICLKEYINEKDYEKINELQQLCSTKDKVNLKLELEYKLNIAKNSESAMKNINELFYYVEDTLVAYLGISNFSGSIGEINGVTHPDWRRKGFFKKLFMLAMEECEKRGFDKILLLADGKSNSGIEFIKAMGGNYDFSEYRMEKNEKDVFGDSSTISLRKAQAKDRKVIARQNAIFFNDKEPEEESEFTELEEDGPNNFTYVAELNKEVIGKIKVEYGDTWSFIYGFGILPAFRGKGYGKATLKEALRLIQEKNISHFELDVECKNARALNLYTSCGFKEKSIMNYYSYKIK